MQRPFRPVRSTTFVAACAMATFAVACATPDSAILAGELPALRHDTAAVQIETATDTLRITVEIAESRQQQMQGLMERDSLPPDHGMLFVYRTVQDRSREFYMFRTQIPLDIAFVGEDERIARIVTMEPCELPNPELCRRYAAEVPFIMALEMARGFFEAHGVGIGDRIALVDAR